MIQEIEGDNYISLKLFSHSIIGDGARVKFSPRLLRWFSNWGYMEINTWGYTEMHGVT